METSERQRLEHQLKALGASLRSGAERPEACPEFDRFYEVAALLGALMLGMHVQALGASRVRELVADWLSAHYRDVARADNPAAFLQRALRNWASSWLRSPKSRVKMPNSSDDAADPTSGEDLLHARMEASQMLEQIQHRINALPDGEREVFIALVIRGDTYVEVAEELGLSVPLVYKRLSRARQRMKESGL